MKAFGSKSFLLHLQTYARIILATLISLTVLRLFQYLSMPRNITATLPGWLITLEFFGLIGDMYLWIIIAFMMLIPFILFSFIRRWIGIFLIMLIFLIAAITELALFNYYTATLVPLDNVVFSYTLDEMIMITGASGRINFSSIMPMVMFAFLFIFLVYWFLKNDLKMTIKRMVSILVFSLVIVVVQVIAMPSSTDGFTNHVRMNKTAYFYKKCAEWRRHHNELPPGEKEIRDVTVRYQALNNGFEYLGLNYPFLHKETTEDILGKYFDFGDERPNIVFIISESLSSCFTGKDTWFGSFTPFLDSLAGKSLYWNNCLATSERTFGVLPAIFASAPPGDPYFVGAQSKMVSHHSSIRSLRESGYYTSFFYGGDPKFNLMEDFLKRQGINYIIDGYGSKYRTIIVNDQYLWGHPDSELFARSLDLVDSLKAEPRLDIYMTLSLHSPFTPPGSEKFVKESEARIVANGKQRISEEELQSDVNIFATVMYADNALRVFFNKYKKRKEFANTIFIITGDHALPELNMMQYSYIERYRVPLVIYSPLLNKAAHFRSVVSHLDITPSLMAMLKNSFNVSVPENTAWLGSGLETSVKYENNKRQAFILNSKEIVEYLDRDYFIFSDKLYKVVEDLETKNYTDEKILARMTRELKDFKILNTWTTKNEKLIPGEMFYLKVRDSIEIPIKDTTYFPPSDSVSIFRSLVRDDSFSSETRVVKVEITIEIQNADEDPGKIPQIGFDVCNSVGKTLLWESIEIPKERLVKKSKVWKTIKMSKIFDLNYLNADSQFTLKMYIYNNKQSSACFRHPHVKLTGYY